MFFFVGEDGLFFVMYFFCRIYHEVRCRVDVWCSLFDMFRAEVLQVGVFEVFHEFEAGFIVAEFIRDLGVPVCICGPKFAGVSVMLVISQIGDHQHEECW